MAHSQQGRRIKDKALDKSTGKKTSCTDLRTSSHTAPHLSLLYANLTLLEKQSLIESTIPPLNRVSFDRLRFVEYPEKIEYAKDVLRFTKLPV